MPFSFIDRQPPDTRNTTAINSLLIVANMEVLPIPMLPVSSFFMIHLLLSLAAADSLHGQGAPARNEVDDVHRLNAIAVFDKDVVKRKD